MNTAGKVISVANNGEQQMLYVSHVTIRQSIFFLLLKLIILEVFAGASIIAFNTFFNISNIPAFNAPFGLFNIPVFILLVIGKTLLTIFIVIQWVNEYYEITPTEVHHRKGLIFQKQERYTLAHLGRLSVEQGIFGRIFNFGSIKLYDWVLEKDATLYLVHNPMKYQAILKNIIKDVDEDKTVLKEHLIEKERI